MPVLLEDYSQIINTNCVVNISKILLLQVVD